MRYQSLALIMAVASISCIVTASVTKAIKRSVKRHQGIASSPNERCGSRSNLGLASPHARRYFLSLAVARARTESA